MNFDDVVYFCPPGRLIIGAGVRHQLPALLKRLGYRRGLIVTDVFFANKTPWVDEYVAAARTLGLENEVYAGGQPDPTTTLCDEATSALGPRFRAGMPDHVIAIGGGSNIDLAKALCLTLPEGRPVLDFVGDIAWARPLPLIALPTTAGTGSEATPGTILLDPRNATKVALSDNALRPAIALIDPELTYTCPPRVTADAGIDAFTHAIESYLTIDSAHYDRAGHSDPGYSGRSSLTMMFAREAMQLCIRWLERAYSHGDDVQARTGMAYASVLAAMSYGSAGLHAVHGIAYAVAGQTHMSHGSTNAVVLPYVLDALWNVRRTEMLEIARFLGIPTGDENHAVREVPRRVRGLVGRLGIPTDLRAFGVSEADLPRLCSEALGVSRLAKALPLPNVAEAYRSIIEHAWSGRLSADDDATGPG
jgi:alcohol dehydrogenase